MCAFSYGGRVKIRDEATVRSKASYFALAVLPDGTRDILGLWIEQTEGAKGVSGWLFGLRRIATPHAMPHTRNS
jgi:transposase-like protein